MTDESITYSLEISFPDQSESFCLGYEAGLIHAAMERGEPIERTVHTANLEMIARVAKHFDYKFDTDYFAPVLDHDGTWAQLRAAPGPKIQ